MDQIADDRHAHVQQQIAALAARVYQLELERATGPGVAHLPPRAAAAPPPAEAESLETTLGTYWLSRIGIVSLITGAALLILTYFGALGPILRVGLGYAMAGGLAYAGLRLARRHATFGQIVFGGGLAIGYFVTYALHFVPAMQIIDSETLGVVLVALAIAGIVVTAHRMQSETVAGIALFLGLHTGMLSDVTTLSLVCTTLLAAGAAFFLAANRWVIVPFSTVVAVYSTHATLALGHAGGGVAPELTVAFLAVDFVLFAGASLIHPARRAGTLWVLSLLNWLGVLVLGSHALHHISHAAVFGFLAAFSAAHLLTAALAHLRAAPRGFVALQVALAFITLGLALPVELTGAPLLGALLALGVASAVAGRIAGWPAFAMLAFGFLLCAQADAAVLETGTPALIACALAWFACERLHAPAAEATAPRGLYIAAVTLALLGVVYTAAPDEALALGWIGVAVALFAAGFALRASLYRWAAFCVLGVTAARFLGVQLRVLSATERIATFVVAGAVLLAVSFVYTRLRKPS